MQDIYIHMPKGLENLALPDPALVSYYIDLDNRVIWLDEEVGDGTLEIVKKILHWNNQDTAIPVEGRKPIKILFNSPGGSLSINYTLIDVIALSKTPVYGINMGTCMSAAAYIFLACHKRFMLEHAVFLLHQGSAENISGSYSEIIANIENYQAQVEELSRHVAKYTKYTEEEISNNIVNEWYIYKDEAIEKGLVDKVIEGIEIFR